MRFMRVRLVKVVGLALLLGALVPVAAGAAGPDVVVSGSGWGHGVGLSQYGAKAMAADGATYVEILNRYFTGVSTVPVASVAPETFAVTDPDPLWVGILQDQSGVTFAISGDSARLCFDDSGLCPRTAQSGETWRFGPDQTGSCVFQRPRGDGTFLPVGYAGSCDASVRPASGLTNIGIPFKARTYRNGTFRFRQSGVGGPIHVVFETGIENYLRGLSEVPESWAPAALEAQVVTLRSATYWKLLDSGDATDFSVVVKADCYCHIRDGSPDPVFRGATGEGVHPNWVGAVNSTARQVMRTTDGLARGMYSSSSGGVTESYEDVFGAPGYSHLVSVGDSAAFSDSAANPHTSWAAGYSQATLAGAFGLSWVSNVSVASRNPSGSARTVRISGIVEGRPTELTVGGVEFRSALSLRSTTFDVVTTPRFDDVAVDDLFAGEVLGLVESGITSGCTSSSFCPRGVVTRGQMAAFLVRALDLPRVPGDSFSDDDGSFFESDIEALRASGITAGCTTTTFCPDRMVTRAEMAAFLLRGFGLDAAPGDTFLDVEGSFFQSDIEVLVASGVTSGCTPTRYCPTAPVTREQMAAFLIRALAVE
jgi:SpoIID/LytB domain protein